MHAIERREGELKAQPTTWLVTGAAGFIGSHLVQRLLELGQTVRGLDNFSTGHAQNLDDVRRQLETGGDATAWSRFRMIEGDVRDAKACETACAGVAHVLHQAAIGSVPRSIAEPRVSHESNVDGFFNMLEAARRAACESFVYASSSSVYGDRVELPKAEGDVGNPLSPYAATKRVNELYALAFQSCYAMPIVGLRYFNVVGPRQDPAGAYAAVVPRWIAALARGQAPVIFGDGETTRDFCPVRNAVQANILGAGARAEVGRSIFNIALGGQLSLNGLFGILRDGLAGLGAPCGGLQPSYQDFRAGDIRHSLASIEHARTVLGYEPLVDVRSGLDETMQWFWRHHES